MMKKLLQLLRDNAAAERKPLALVRADGSNDATLYVYDVIDAYWGVAAADVAKAIAALGSDVTLHVRINSPGGDVFEGRAIAAAIQQHAGATIAHVDGLAASAATTVANACDTVQIVEGGFYMIHNAWSIVLGNKNDMRSVADLLDKVDAALVADYAKRTGATAEQIAAWMDAETWFTAQEAVDAGFATAIAAPADKAKNLADNKAWNLAAYDKTPQALLAPPAPAEPAAPDAAAVRAANARRLQLLEIA